MPRTTRATSDRHGGGRPTPAGRARLLLRVLAATLAVAVGAGLTPALATSAAAADGDYALTLTVPATVPVRQAFSYDATVAVEASADHPATGIVLTAHLPEGVAFESVPTGPGSPVESSSYDAATRTVTFTLRDLTEQLVAFSIAVTQVDNESKDESTALTATLEGSPGPGGAPAPVTATTRTVGNHDYKPTDELQVLVGSGNRVVTYYLDVSTVSPWGATFTSWSQRLAADLPAGARVVNHSKTLGTWDLTTRPDGSTSTVWTRDGQYGPAVLSLSSPPRQIWITVEYPRATFPDGTRPPAHVVSLETTDASGTTHTQPDARVQAPELQPGGGAAVTVVKGAAGGLDKATFEHGAWQSAYETAASYIAAGDPDLESLTVTDDSSRSPENAAVFDHLDVYRLAVRFNSALSDAAVPYTVEYTASDQPGVWQTYSPAHPTTDRDLRILVQTVGSQGFEETGYVRGIDLPAGAHLTGWRVVVSPDAATTVPDTAEVRVHTSGIASLPSLADGTAPAGPLVNTADVDAVTATGATISHSDPLQITVVDRVPVMTNVVPPVSMQVGGTATYLATISNLDPAGRSYADSVLRVVLPVGVFYDASVGVTPRTEKTIVSGVTIPAAGEGMEVTTSTVTDAAGAVHQVVELRIDDLASIRTAGTVRSRADTGDGFRYTVPVMVQPGAYSAAGSPAPVSSWASTDDPTFTTTPMAYWPVNYGADVYDFNPALPTIAKSTGTSVVTAAGGLLMGKLVRADSTSPWAPDAAVSSPGTAEWQVDVRNVLPSPVTDLVVFDRLPATADGRGSSFGVTLSGAASGAPSGSTVEYSTDATTATDGTWTTDPTGATALRVTVGQVDAGTGFTLTVPTTVPAGLSVADSAANDVTASGRYLGTPRTFSSNEATVAPAAAPALSLVKTTNGTHHDSAPGELVTTGSEVTWAYTVRNTGTTPLDQVTVEDVFTAGDGSTGAESPTSPDTGLLLPGEERTFTAHGTAVAGQYENTATASAVSVAVDGTPLPEQPDPAVDTSWYSATATSPVVTPDPVITPDPVVTDPTTPGPAPGGAGDGAPEAGGLAPGATDGPGAVDQSAPAPTGALASTGVTVALALAGAALLLVLGLVMVRAARRRRA